MKQDNTKLAVKCNNGTFVGKETDELIIWKGIPYATQPVGKLRWKKFSGDDRQTMVFDDAIGMQKDISERREDLMMSWAERLGNGSSKRVC